jgi:hydrogenase-4 component C
MNPVALIGVGVVQALLLLLAAPLFSGFVRVLRAKIQTRKGPPLIQNYRDIVKLMKRQEVISDQAGWIFRITPYVVMATMLLTTMILPIFVVQSPLGMVGDLLLVIYLFTLPRFLLSLAGMETGSTFGGIGARRELLISTLVEPVLLLVVFILALLAGSTNLGIISTKVATSSLPYSIAFLLSLAAFAFATFVEMGKLPFDLAEAEQELQEGGLSEYSGRSLAILKWGIYLRQLVLVALFLALFLPFGSMTTISLTAALLALVAFFAKAIIFYFIVAVLENTMARMRFMKAPAATWLALGAAVLSFVFYLAKV